MSCKLLECFVLLDRLKEEEIGAAQPVDGKNKSDKLNGPKIQRFGKDISQATNFHSLDLNLHQKDKFICSRSRTKYLRKNFNNNYNISSKYSSNEEFLSIRVMKSKKRNHDEDSDWFPKRCKIKELSRKSTKMKTRSAAKNIFHNSKTNSDVMSLNLIKKLSNGNKRNVSEVPSIEPEASKHPHDFNSASESSSSLLLSRNAKDKKTSSQLEQLSLSKTCKTVSTPRKNDLIEEKRENTGTNCLFGKNETKSGHNCISASELRSTSLMSNQTKPGAKDTKNSTQLVQRILSKSRKSYIRNKNNISFNGATIEPVLQYKNMKDEGKIKESYTRKSQSLVSNISEKRSVQVEYEKSNPKRKNLHDLDKTKNAMATLAVIVAIPSAEQPEDLHNKEETDSFSIPKLSPMDRNFKSIRGNGGFNQKEAFKFLSTSKVLSLTNSIKTIPVEQINKVLMPQEKAVEPGNRTTAQSFFRNNKTTEFLRIKKEGLKLVKANQSSTVSTVQRSPMVKKIQKTVKIVPNVKPKNHFRVKFRAKKSHCPICNTHSLNRQNRKICIDCKLCKPHRSGYNLRKTVKTRMSRKRINHIEFSHDLSGAKQQTLERDKNSSELQNKMVISEPRNENSKNILSKIIFESNKNISHCFVTNTTLINIEEEESKSTTNRNKIVEDVLNYSFLKPSYQEFENNAISSAMLELDSLTLLAITDNERDPRSGISFRMMLTKKVLKNLKQETSITPELTENIASCENNLEVLTLAKKYLCLFGSFEKVSDYFLRKQEMSNID